MLRTNKLFNKTATNNIVLQDVNSNIQASLLYTCTSWIILIVSSLLLTQVSPSRAMDSSDDLAHTSHINAGLNVPSSLDNEKSAASGFYKNSQHPLTQDFWKEHDLSDRLKKLKPDIDRIKEEIKNYKTDFIENTEKILKNLLCSRCNSESPQFLQDIPIPHNELIISTDNAKEIENGRSGNEVIIVSRNNKNLIAIKKFTNKDEIKKVDQIEEGLKELLHSLIALELNPCPEKLKMARIFDAVLCPKNSLNIIMEAANGLDLDQFLSRADAGYVVKGCANYLAAFHIENYQNVNKNIKNTDGIKYINHVANAYHTLLLNLLTEEEKADLVLLDLSIGTMSLDPNEKVTSKNIIKLLTGEKPIRFKELVKKSCEKFEENCGKIFRSEGPYFLTITHGDAQKDNFFYNNSEDLRDTNGSEIEKDSFHRVTMIDFASIIKTYGYIGDPAEDVGRFLGSLWDLASQSNDLELENEKKISALQEQFISTYLDNITKSNIFSEKDKKIFEGIFRENCNFYKLRFYRAVFNTEKDKTIKLQILKSWIKESTDLLGSVQKNSQAGFVAEEFERRSWPEGKEETLCPNLPDLVEGFITSAAEGEESYLTRLWKTFHIDAIPCVAVIGMGGIGKTSLTVAYAQEALSKKFYKLIYRIPSSSETSLQKAYGDLLREIYPKDKRLSIKDLDFQRVIDLVKTHLPEKSLLIYDDVPPTYGDGISAPTFLKDKIPENKNTHILVTSRYEGWNFTLPLQVFCHEDSIKYLLQITGLEKIDDNKEIAGKLAMELYHFPLALAHAGHYLKFVGGKVEDFKKYIEGFGKINIEYFEKNKNSFTEKESKINYEYLIGKTIQISKKYLEAKGIAELAKKFLSYCSYLDPDSIQEEIFQEHWLNQEEKEKIKDVFNTLAALSLINKKQGHSLFSMHSLAQRVIRNENQSRDKKQCDEILSSLFILFNKLFDQNSSSIDKITKLNFLPHIFQLLEHSQHLKVISQEMVRLKWVGIILYSTLMPNKICQDKEKWNHENKLKTLIKLQGMYKGHTNGEDFPDKIVEKSDCTIQYSLCLMYDVGFFLKPDIQKALQWANIAAEKNCAEAQNYLGLYYLNTNDYKKAAAWGNIEAQKKLDSMSLVVFNDSEQLIKYKRAVFISIRFFLVVPVLYYYLVNVLFF